MTDNSPDDFDALFLKARTGGPDAAQVFFDQYAQSILTVVRAKMNTDLRRVFDSNDFLQAARIKLLLCEIEKKHFETPQAFLAYLMRIAENEVTQAKRKMHNQTKHTLQPGQPPKTLSTEEMHELVDSAPAVFDVLVTEEDWRNALGRLSFVHREIAMLLREGYQHKEIAEKFGVPERTVGRAVVRLAAALGIDEPEED